MQTINMLLLAGILALAAPAYMAARGSDTARKDTTLPQKPEDRPDLFTRHLNAGDPDARFVGRSGEMIVGRERIREALAGLVRNRTNLKSRVVKAVTVGDVALVYTDLEGTALDASGTTPNGRE